MKFAFIGLAVALGAVLMFAVARFLDQSIAPLLLNSRIGRLGETNLPRVIVQGGNLYCRMKADDFRFPLPPGSRAVNPVVGGGFDTANGSVEARFDGTNQITVSEYKAFSQAKCRLGAGLRRRRYRTAYL